MTENKPEVWFGEMEFGNLDVGDGSDNPIAIIHNIFEKRWMNPSEVEDYAKGCDWLVPSEFAGDIVFSRTFMKTLTR